MMGRDIHRPKTAHGKAADATVRCFRNSAILLINILDQVDSNVRLDELALIEAVAPFACFSWSSITIGQNQDELGYLAESNQGVSSLISLAARKPITDSPWCSM